jgi:hypothetical protein
MGSLKGNAVEFSKIPLNPPLEKGDLQAAPPFRKGGFEGICRSLDPPEIHNSTILAIKPARI